MRIHIILGRGELKSFQEHFHDQLCTDKGGDSPATTLLSVQLFQLYREFNYWAAQCTNQALSMKPRCCPQPARKAVPLLCPQLCSGCQGWTEKHIVHVTYRPSLEKHSARPQAVQDAPLNPDRPNTEQKKSESWLNKVYILYGTCNAVVLFSRPCQHCGGGVEQHKPTDALS